MNLSFFTVTVLYLSLLLYLHYKLKSKEEPIIQSVNTPKQSRNKIDTIISLDDIDEDIENETIEDLKKFLATPEIKAKENFAPIIENLDINEYFDDDESDDIVETQPEQDTENQDDEINNVQPFDSIKAFDDFGGYENYATV